MHEELKLARKAFDVNEDTLANAEWKALSYTRLDHRLQHKHPERWHGYSHLSVYCKVATWAGSWIRVHIILWLSKAPRGCALLNNVLLSTYFFFLVIFQIMISFIGFWYLRCHGECTVFFSACELLGITVVWSDFEYDLVETRSEFGRIAVIDRSDCDQSSVGLRSEFDWIVVRV